MCNETGYHAVAVISLIFVVLVIIYLILRKIIPDKWPNSKFNKFFGGEPPISPADILIADLQYAYNNNPNDNNTIDSIITTALGQQGGREVVLRAIAQSIVRRELDDNLINKIIARCVTEHIINGQNEIDDDLRNALDDDLVNAIMNRIRYLNNLNSRQREFNAGQSSLQRTPDASTQQNNPNQSI